MEIEGGEWKFRYKLERDLEEILTYEQNVWRKSSEKWTLQGDGNTCFFHNVANGRRAKCTIFSLENDEGETSDMKDLCKHIEDYYKNLFGSEERGSIRLW
jgi:hypothetical protein